MTAQPCRHLLHRRCRDTAGQGWRRIGRFSCWPHGGCFAEGGKSLAGFRPPTPSYFQLQCPSSRSPRCAPIRCGFMPVSSTNDHRVLPSDSSSVFGQLARIESDESMFITRRRIVEHIYGPPLETFSADCPDHSIPQTRVRPDELQDSQKAARTAK